ncbi:neutral zinc metallopeptidase [Nonomuraea gerenzanensis]|uniref:YpfJ protein, zinc metalloprotease superfamily n=1 Tax=Nonomuraea gerenzanensis TaxID=93944 RepID=A0A1M4E026_9ACTN|nr:neutral zinc metallopeptidase [Nonomuraea gerenzanensis]UBU14457.1 neutral zinc metallopeptidase [Nonomuraea gerenzanensis]SBO92173.1 YpfJ protein, zinc metalloprotease superfamily [Nonomuraea gerenzanensis]
MKPVTRALPKLTRLFAGLAVITLAAACGLARPPSMDTRGADSFEDDIVTARTLTEEFWNGQFQQLGRTYRPISDFIPYSGSAGPSCGGEPAVPNNAFYCPLGHFIAFDQDWMQGLWNDMGDGAVYVIIPHELGHAIQAQLRTDFTLNVQMELQADCYAGGALSALVSSGVLTTDEGDENELFASLAAAGDPTDDWLNPAAHGTAEQRQISFVRGYRDGVGAC